MRDQDHRALDLGESVIGLAEQPAQHPSIQVDDVVGLLPEDRAPHAPELLRQLLEAFGDRSLRIDQPFADPLLDGIHQRGVLEDPDVEVEDLRGVGSELLLGLGPKGLQLLQGGSDRQPEPLDLGFDVLSEDFAFGNVPLDRIQDEGSSNGDTGRNRDPLNSFHRIGARNRAVRRLDPEPSQYTGSHFSRHF